MRIAIGAFMYEANSFSPVQTTLDDFAAGTLVRGAAMLDYFRNTNTEVAGFLHACAVLPAAEVVPLLAADANPAGLVQAATYVALRDELLDRLTRAQRTRPARRRPAGATRGDGRRGRGRPRRRCLGGRARHRWAGGAHRSLARPAR